MFPADSIPELIGTYRIVRRLAPVGPADVYLARTEGPLGFQRECDLKLLPDTSEGQAEFAEELAREAAICSKLNNPTVVRLFDFFEHEDKLVLVLEHVEGVTLVELMAWLEAKSEKLSDAATLFIGSKIAGALADAHAATDEQGQPMPIVHRNLTPENVLIARDGEVRLTGFGVGKIVGRTADTVAGRIKGTPGFMAPEQARGEPVTTKADVYGLGVLMWSLLAWRRPPTDGTWPRKVSGLRTDLSREVAAVVDAALDHFPGTRKITAREIERWLAKATSQAKGKAELRDRVAALRAELGAKDDESPASSKKNPFEGVKFGPPGAADGAPRAAAKRAAEKAPAPPLARAVMNLPAPPPAEAPSAPRFGAPPPDAPDAPPPPPPRQPTLPGIAPSGEPYVPGANGASPSAPELPKPSILPTAGPVLAAVASLPRAQLPRSSLLGIAPPSPEALARAEQEVRAQKAALAAAPASPPSVSAPPAAPPTPSARRPLSPAATIAVSAITAALVVAVALYLFVRRSGGSTTTPAASAKATATTAIVAPPRPTASAVATSTAAPVTTTAPTASATAAASVNPADLPYGYGYLMVVSPARAAVYLNGKPAGPVNDPLRVRCGRFFVRLALPGAARVPEWVSPGETVVIACQRMTRLVMGPKAQ